MRRGIHDGFLSRALTLSAVVWIAGFTLLPSSARADEFFLHGWQEHHEPLARFALKPEFLYYASTTNFAPDGTTYLPRNFQKYTRLQFDTYVDYGLTPAVTLFGRLSWAQAHVDATSMNAGTFGLSDSLAGLSARVWENKSGTALDLQFQGTIAPYDNQLNIQQGTPFLGNAIDEISLGGFLTLPLGTSDTGRWNVVGGGAYTKRSAPFSAAFDWSGYVEHRPGDQGFAGRLGAFGTQALETDPLLSTPIANLNPLGSGGSFATGSTHPSLVSLRAEAGYQLDQKLSLALVWIDSLTGKSAPLGMAIGAQAVIHFGGSTKGAISKSPKEYGKSNQGFVDYTMEAKVIRINDRLNQVKIDKGSGAGVEADQTFDIFAAKPGGEAREAIARATVVDVKSEEATLQIDEFYREVLIEEGFLAKRPLQ